MSKRQFTCIPVRIEDEDAAYLRAMAKEARVPMAALIRGIIVDVISDDREAHGERAA